MPGNNNNSSNRKLTDEQVAIIEAVRRGDRVVTVQAFAGTGKTTTLLELSKQLPRTRILYLAFNRSIVKASRKLFPQNVEVTTVHSLAWRRTASTLGLNGNIRAQWRAAELLDVGIARDLDEALAVTALLTTWCHSSSPEPQINRLLQHDGRLRRLLYPLLRTGRIDPDRIEKLVQEVFSKMIRGELECTHDVYLKYYQLNQQRLESEKWDLVLVDEAQDSNPVTLALLPALANQYVFVGDQYQQIYGFRGSVNAMKLVGGTKLHLTRSWRMAPSVATEATALLRTWFNENKRIVPGLNGRVNGIRSIALLSRTNAGLLAQAERMLREGFDKFQIARPVRDIVDLPLALLRVTSCWRRHEKVTLNPQSRYRWLLLFRNVDELEEYIEETHDIELQRALTLVKIRGARLIELARSLEKIQSSNGSTKLFTLSTTHVAKGLEWDRVVVLPDFPNLMREIARLGIATRREWLKLARQTSSHDISWIVEEINLLYVALTRARQRVELRGESVMYTNLSEDMFDRLLMQNLEELADAKLET